MSESIQDVLETYELDERVDDVINTVQEAQDAGVSKKDATPTIVVHTVHVNSHKTWVEICNELGVDADRLLETRKELVRSDVITNKVESPSELVQGRPAELLELAENAHSDEIYDGTSPNSWVAGAIYLDEWINLRETPVEEVADRYDCNTKTVTDAAENLVVLRVFPRAYTADELDGSLGRVLARRRHSIETLRRSISDTSSGVRTRLDALEKSGEWQLESTAFGGTTFYWTYD